GATEFYTYIYKKRTMLQRIIQTDNSATTILIRLMTGVVFLSEGIQKFLYPTTRGTGRFEKIGLPSPEFFGPFVGTFEIVCGVLILVGFFTRLASVPTIVIMCVAIITTKLKILTESGLLEMLHESRTDWAMLLGSIFLLVKGGGRFSVDRFVSRERLI